MAARPKAQKMGQTTDGQAVLPWYDVIIFGLGWQIRGESDDQKGRDKSGAKRFQIELAVTAEPASDCL